MSSLIERLRKARELTLAVSDGVTLVLRRPSELDALRVHRGDVDERFWLAHLVGWIGVTEETIEGKGVGNTSLVAYEPTLAADWILHERFEWVIAIRDKLVEALNKHFQSKQATQGNSTPS